MRYLTIDDLQNEEIAITENIEEAVYILPDGTLWDGGFDYGLRGVEHREVEVFTKTDRYDGNQFWSDVMVGLGLVMLIPESKLVLNHPDHVETDEQMSKIMDAVELGYEIELFV